MLSSQKCTPCQGKDSLASHDDITQFLKETPGWALAHGGVAIFRKYIFPDFDTAYAFAGKVAALAQEQNHHPDIAFGWGYVKLKLWTHAIGGLHANDFIMAAKINTLS